MGGGAVKGSHPQYSPIALSSWSTVVAEHTPEASGSDYQSEAQLEAELIALLQSQAYEYLPITSERQLVANLRRLSASC